MRVVDTSKDMIKHTISISCHALTRLQAAQLTEEIRYILKVTERTNMRANRLHGPNITGTDESSDFIGAVKYYTKKIDYLFWRMSQ